MSYNNIRKKLNKYAKGGNIQKLQFGGSTYEWDETRAEDPGTADYWIKKGMLPKQAELQAKSVQNGLSNPQTLAPTTQYLDQTKKVADTTGLSFNKETNKVAGDVQITDEEVNPEEFFEGDTPQPQPIQPSANNLPSAGGPPSQLGSEIASAAFQAADQATMGDKNFSASSQAIDSAVHGVSGALMKSGNPYAMAAGAALEGINFLTKAGGKNVQGYDVGIDNSGYGNLSHQESEAGRIWESRSSLRNRLNRRNEQARMALAAADISQDQSFEQEARANSVTNVLQQNQIALAGGIDTSLLGS